MQIQKINILPKIKNAKYFENAPNISNKSNISNVPKLPKLPNPSNISNKSNQNNKKILVKQRSQCLDAEEYLSQFNHIPNIYNINEFNSKLIYLKKILLNKNIFLLKTGWTDIWNEPVYSFDKAEEMICKRYNTFIKSKYNAYKNKCNLSKYNYPDNLMCLLYAKELVSFVFVSDYSIYSGKITGKVKICFSCANLNDKNIIFSCIRETFLDRFVYENNTNTFTIQLKKN